MKFSPSAVAHLSHIFVYMYMCVYERCFRCCINLILAYAIHIYIHVYICMFMSSSFICLLYIFYIFTFHSLYTLFHN